MKTSKEIESLIPYKPGKPIEETKREFDLEIVYKLASNENPLEPSAKVRDAIISGINEINRYPDASCYELKKRFSEKFNISEEEMVFGNGSNELIDLLIRVYCRPGDKILTSKSAFIAYKICAQAASVETVEVDLNENLKFNLDEFAQRIHTDDKIKLVFIPNPNNPTGTYLSTTEIESFLEKIKDKKDILIVFDEAYLEFVRAEDYPNALELYDKYSNVCVLRTFSKVYGLAGLRIGLMVAAPEISDYVNRIRNPFNVNSLAQVALLAAIDDNDSLKKSQKVVWEGLDDFYKVFDENNIKYWPSQGNFVLFETGKDAEKVFVELLKMGIITRPIKGYGLPTQLRLSVGSPEENQAAIKGIVEVLKS